MPLVPTISHYHSAAPAAQPLTATEVAFNNWLQHLLPGVRTALARQGFEKARHLSAFQQFLQEQS